MSYDDVIQSGDGLEGHEKNFSLNHLTRSNFSVVIKQTLIVLAIPIAQSVIFVLWILFTKKNVVFNFGNKL